MRWTRRTREIGRGNTGQALLEFALVVPLFFLLLFGIMDFGRLFSTQLTLQNALREAGRFTVTGQSLPGYSREDSIIQKAMEASGGLLTLDEITISSIPEGGGAPSSTAGGPGDTVTISIKYDLKLITPLIAKFFPNEGYKFNVSTTFKNEPFLPS
jgi:hypothetical protein